MEACAGSLALQDGCTNLEWISYEVAQEFGLSTRQIFSVDRSDATAAARWVIAYALVEQGSTVAAAARAVGRDHSSIVYGLSRLWKIPHVASIARLYTRGQYARSTRRAVRKLPASVRRPVASYARMLAGRKEDRCLWYRGLCLCCSSVTARQAVIAILQSRGMGEHASRMQMHARQAGLRWMPDSSAGSRKEDQR